MFAFEGKYLYKIMYSDIHHFTKDPTSNQGTEDEDLTMYSCGIRANPEHCLSFENLSSGFLMR